MAIPQIKAPVGIPGGTGNAKLVKNKPDDVIILRRMLAANGHAIPEEGKFDAKLGAVIKSAQKKAGEKAQDGVIQPGDKLCKSLLTKYMLVEKQAADVKMITFKIGSTTHSLTPDAYKTAQASLFKTLEAPTRRLINQVDHTMAQYQFYLDVAMVKDGIVMALVQSSIMTIGRIKFPDDKKMTKAQDAKFQLERCLRAKDLAAYCKAMRTAEQDINAFVVEFRAYVQKMEGSGNSIQGKLEIIKSTAFTSVEILAIPVVMTYTRLPPDKAYIASKTAVAGIESLATDLGKQISGQKVSVSGSLGRATYAMAKEMVLGWFGSKIKFKGPLLTRLMKVLGPALTKAFPFIPKGLAANFAARYVQGFGEEATKAIMAALISAVEGWMKAGKPPSKAEVEKLLDEVVMKAVLGGLGNNLGKFNSAWAAKNQMILRYKLVPTAFKKIDANTVLTEAHRKVLIEKVMTQLQDISLEKGYESVFSDATGHESASALTAKAENALKADRAISAQIEALIAAEVKKHAK